MERALEADSDEDAALDWLRGFEGEAGSGALPGAAAGGAAAFSAENPQLRPPPLRPPPPPSLPGPSSPSAMPDASGGGDAAVPAAGAPAAPVTLQFQTYTVSSYAQPSPGRGKRAVSPPAAAPATGCSACNTFATLCANWPASRLA